MSDELKYLITLQELDGYTDELTEQADSCVAEIKTCQAQISRLKENLKSSKDTLTAHQLKKKSLELDAEKKEGLIKKHQGELNSLKSNDAYKAMLGEIEKAKVDMVKIEDGILGLMEIMDNEQTELKKKEGDNKTKEQEIQGAIKKFEEQKSKSLSEIKIKTEERNKFAETVPAALMGQYETIRQKRGGTAIVPLLGNNCGGCHMSLTPSKVNDVVKAKDMIICESCSRILYLKPEKKQEPVTPAPSDPSSNPVSAS